MYKLTNDLCEIRVPRSHEFEHFKMVLWCIFFDTQACISFTHHNAFNTPANPLSHLNVMEALEEDVNILSRLLFFRFPWRPALITQSHLYPVTWGGAGHRHLNKPCHTKPGSVTGRGRPPLREHFSSQSCFWYFGVSPEGRLELVFLSFCHCCSGVL